MKTVTYFSYSISPSFFSFSLPFGVKSMRQLNYICSRVCKHGLGPTTQAGFACFILKKSWYWILISILQDPNEQLINPMALMEFYKEWKTIILFQPFPRWSSQASRPGQAVYKVSFVFYFAITEIEVVHFTNFELKKDILLQRNKCGVEGSLLS